MGVNIIQHPRGWPKMISVRNNILQYRTDRTLLYETDTEPGSSGSPVFNDTWELVALHHWGEPFLETKDENGNPIPTQINEGVRISAIYRDLEAKLETLPPEQRRLLEQVLAYDRQIVSVPAGGRQLSPPRPAPNPSESAIISPPGAIMTPLSGAQELRVTVPVEITVRVGTTPAAIPVGVQRIEPPPPAKVLTHAAEALQLDRDYSNRAGYDPRFILGLDLPLPQPNAALARQVAPLQQGEPNAARGELKYEHFSLKINKSKRIAVFTATNIDGATYLEVDRRTGQVSTGGSEGETWFKDPRISANFFLDQSFYSEWSDYFDRGHLTRRTDPTWGTSQQAERANADTFHFTNCSPQHFRFNQTTKYWQGAERYVLENGVLATDSPKRLCVFQGPVFDDRIDFWSGDVQIPSSFFKVIVWKSATGPKSVGLVVDQRSLLSETRRNLGQPQAVSAVDVSHWRLSITSIERRTGLDFGATVRDADTISHEGQPQVGEAQIMVKSFSDLLPRAISG